VFPVFSFFRVIKVYSEKQTVIHKQHAERIEHFTAHQKGITFPFGHDSNAVKHEYYEWDDKQGCYALYEEKFILLRLGVLPFFNSIFFDERTEKKYQKCYDPNGQNKNDNHPINRFPPGLKKEIVFICLKKEGYQGQTCRKEPKKQNDFPDT
jgi:hypothetical protein